MSVCVVIFLAALIEVTVRDIRVYEISDITLLVISGSGVAYSYAGGNDINIYSVLTGGAVLMAVYIISQGGIGLGDVKLGMAAGFWLNCQEVLAAQLVAFWLGGLYAVYLLLVKHKSSKMMIPFGPFLAAGIALSFFKGQSLIAFYWRLML